MNAILANLAALGRGRLLTLAAVGAGLVAALIFGLAMITAPVYRPLYGDLTPSAASGIVSALEQGGFDVRISSDGAVVSVPQEDLARARMVLAESNLPAQGAPGWELFDSGSGLGLNSFMQKVNRLRALEGELARSIQTIDGIEAARVHLVLPEREAFSRERPEPSASVIIRAAPRFDLGRKRALAIRNLVSAAVPDLAPAQVTVLSASGEVLLAEDGDGPSEATLQTARAAAEERMARAIEQILTARVGAGNARVQVAVELSAARQVTVEHSFDPSQQVVRSTETSNEDSQGREGGNEGVGVENNLPEALGGPAAGARSQTSRSRNGESVTYEIGNTRRETVREPGEVERVSVAVLVNGIYDRGEGGAVDYRERPPEELERLAALVRSAVGFDEGRGDSVSVDSLRFMDYSMDIGEPVRASVLDALASNATSILRWIFALAMVTTVLMLGVRPALQRALPELAAAGPGLPGPAGAGAGAAISDLSDSQAQLALPGGGAPHQLPALGEGGLPTAQAAAAIARQQVPQLPASDTVRLLTLQSSDMRQRLDALGQIVDDEPDTAVQVLRGWLAEA